MHRAVPVLLLRELHSQRGVERGGSLKIRCAEYHQVQNRDCHEGSYSSPGLATAYCTAGIRSFSSSMRSMRMSRTEAANHGRVCARSIAARTQVTAVTLSPPK